MADETYTISENPKYDPNIRKLQNDDPANAETIFNPLIGKMIENTAAVKWQVDTAEDDIKQLKVDMAEAGSSADLDAHINDKSNPHGVTPAQISAVPVSDKGAAGGVAALGGDGKVPDGQLPISNTICEETEDSTSSIGYVYIKNVTSYDELVGKVIWILPKESRVAGSTRKISINGLEPINIVAQIGSGADSATAYNYIISGIPYGISFRYTADKIQCVFVTFQPRTATLNYTGIVSLSDDVTANSACAATPNAVKTAYDHAEQVQSNLDTHKNDKANPHGVTAAQAGAIPASSIGTAGGVAELGTDGKVPAGQLPEMNYDAKGAAAAVQTNLNTHTGNKANPHEVTKSQVGLGNIDNTSDANKPVSTAQKTAIDAAAAKGDAAQTTANAAKTTADAAMPKAGGTFTGQTTAASGAVGTAQIRNIRAGTADLTAGSTGLTTGEIYLVYE